MFVTAQRKHVPRKTRGTRLRIGCLILSCKVFLNELFPRQHLVETLRVDLDFHVRQTLKKELDIISGRKVVCLCCFYNAVDHCAGLCAGRRVAEQPVLSADSKGADLVLCTVVGDLAARILQIVCNRPAKARPQKDKRHPTQNRVPHFVMQSFPE